jgi:hypothetical protein
MQKLWDEAKEALKGIVKAVFDNDGTGIDIGFVNSDSGTRDSGAARLQRAVSRSGLCPCSLICISHPEKFLPSLLNWSTER